MAERAEDVAADGGANEAIWLKTLSEEKYEKSYYTSALKYAKRAQSLDPNLGGLTEMVTALRILRMAKEKIEGLGSLDWYKILQLEPFSSVDVVKKRYKKLALALHPDKTSFFGCGEAFKLVRDALRCLVSVERRKEFDLKLRVMIQDEAMRKGKWKWRDFGAGVMIVGLCVGLRGSMLGRKSFVALEVERSDDSDVILSDEDTDGDNDGDEGGEERGAAGKVLGADDGVMVEMKKGRESIVVYCRMKKLSDTRGSGVPAERSGGEGRSERLSEKRMKVVGEDMTLAELQSEAKERKKSLVKKTTKKTVAGTRFHRWKENENFRGVVLRNEARKHSENNDFDSEEEDSETEMSRLSALKKKKVDVAKSNSVSRRSRWDDASVESDHLETGNFEI